MSLESNSAQELAILPHDVARLLSIAQRLAAREDTTVTAAVSRIEHLVHNNAGKPQRNLAHFADRLRLLRLRRNEEIGADLFRDPAWDILLALFSAYKEGRRVTVISLCHASGTPIATAIRHLARLESSGLIRRVNDSADGRRQIIEPTAKSMAAIERLVAMLAAEVKNASVYGNH